MQDDGSRVVEERMVSPGIANCQERLFEMSVGFSIARVPAGLGVFRWTS
jgi:hypothetical protein